MSLSDKDKITLEAKENLFQESLKVGKGKGIYAQDHCHPFRDQDITPREAAYSNISP